MRDPKIFTNSDGWPIVQITLDSSEVSEIGMHLRNAAAEHAERVFKKTADPNEDVHPYAHEAICENWEQVGKWTILARQMDEAFWRRAEDYIPADFPMYPKDIHVCNDCMDDDDLPDLAIVPDDEEGE